MEIVAERLRVLRHSVNISQAKLAKAIGLQQSAINRYENNQTDPSCDTLLRYADYFDVSADYLLGRTENPKGAAFEGKVKMEASYPEMEKFIEMCFDPSSPMNARLKETLMNMLSEVEKKT